MTAMIEPSTWLAFVAAVTVLMLLPGPNVALIVANSVASGPRYGLLTVAGTSAAMILQLALTAAGLSAFLREAGSAFELLRYAGVAYLLYLGLRQWFAPPDDLSRVSAEPKRARAIFTRALIVSLTNPKTLFFYGAFFPQFVRLDRPAGPQIAILSATFIAIAVLVDGSWAILAGRARGFLAGRGRLRNRLSGGFLVGAAALLATARVK